MHPSAAAVPETTTFRFRSVIGARNPRGIRLLFALISDAQRSMHKFRPLHGAHFSYEPILAWIVRGIRLEIGSYMSGRGRSLGTQSEMPSRTAIFKNVIIG
jgi:hypothetical protein